MKKILAFVLLASLFGSCKKQDWLDVKSAKSDVVPKTLKDFQAILDNDPVMNANYPGIGKLGSDNFYVTYESWLGALNALERNAYIWKPEIFEGTTGFDWNYEYSLIAYANIVLEGLSKINPSETERSAWNNIRGSALFYRSYAFYDLAQLFAKPWDSVTSLTDLGIPLRMTADVNVPSIRSSLKETYDRIITDLKEAKELLPVTPLYSTRPSKAAADGLLARVYFNMEDYSAALSSSEACLGQRLNLLDFNSLDSNAFISLPNYQSVNPEMIFFSSLLPYSLGFFPMVDTMLYNSYLPGDLRRAIFYRSRPDGKVFTGNYTGSVYGFGGIATNEMVLMNAESNARLGNTPQAMDALNTLLLKRYAEGTFIPITASNLEEAVSKIIVERRKELPFTGSLRWQELRRLNKDPSRAVTLTRLLNGEVYTLLPNDNRYVYPIPPDEIRLSGIPQNAR